MAACSHAAFAPQRIQRRPRGGGCREAPLVRVLAPMAPCRVDRWGDDGRRNCQRRAFQGLAGGTHGFFAKGVGGFYSRDGGEEENRDSVDSQFIYQSGELVLQARCYGHARAALEHVHGARIFEFVCVCQRVSERARVHVCLYRRKSVFWRRDVSCPYEDTQTFHTQAHTMMNTCRYTHTHTHSSCLPPYMPFMKIYIHAYPHIITH